jgi:hypothetical protein
VTTDDGEGDDEDSRARARRGRGGGMPMPCLPFSQYSVASRWRERPCRLSTHQDNHRVLWAGLARNPDKPMTKPTGERPPDLKRKGASRLELEPSKA